MVAGGRRLAALKALAADGVLDAAHPVPCLIVDGDAPSAELSLAENVVRIAMHPADQVAAFRDLAESGSTVSSIAARFGISERLVEQRLRLGNAAPELLDAYRAGAIDLETLKGFAVTTDHRRQMTVYEQVANQGYRPTAWQVKRLLTQDRVPANSAVAHFVGVDAYEAAGGAVLRDLFSEEDESGVWLEDPVLLNNLAMEKLDETAKDLATRWRWATAVPEVDWTELARYGRIQPEPATPTAEQTAELERLRSREDELCELDEDEWTEQLGEEACAIETRTDEIHAAVEARAAYQAEDYAIAGCIATIGRDGKLQVIKGLVRPGDIPKPADAAKSNGDDAGDGDNGDATGSDRLRGPSISGPLAPAPDPEAEARKEAGVGIGLSDDLRSIRTALVKAHLGKDFEAAFDLMLFQLGRAVFTHGCQAHALDIAIRETLDRPTMRMNDQDFGGWSPGEAMLADRSGLPLDWLTIQDDAESFAALRALPQADKEALFAASVARTVKGQLAFEPQARPELEATIARLGIDFAGSVRPTADMLWSRINKGRILDIARETLGAAWAPARAKSKKADLAKAMEEAFAAGSPPLGVTADAHAAALAWTPPGFAAFDAGRPGVEDAGVDTDGARRRPQPPWPMRKRQRNRTTPARWSRWNHGTPTRLPTAPEPVSVAESNEVTESTEPGAAAIAVNDDAVVRAANGHDNGQGLDIPEFLRRV